MVKKRPVFLLTDFGDQDAYVGVMKAVIASIDSELAVIDLCHHIQPQNVVSAAYVLWTAIPFVPAGSVVVAVVDPGVGSEREIVALNSEYCTLLVPDNGLATMVVERYAFSNAWTIEWERFCSTPPSATFHGRDIFAPAAALLASGQRTLEQIATPRELSSLARLDLSPRQTSQGIIARVLHCDRFGNLVTNVEATYWGITADTGWYCEIAGRLIPVVRTYACVDVGEPLAYIGSSGFVEIGVRNGNAAAQYGEVTSIRLFRGNS